MACVCAGDSGARVFGSRGLHVRYGAELRRLIPSADARVHACCAAALTYDTVNCNSVRSMYFTLRNSLLAFATLFGCNNAFDSDLSIAAAAGHVHVDERE